MLRPRPSFPLPPPSRAAPAYTPPTTQLSSYPSIRPLRFTCAAACKLRRHDYRGSRVKCWVKPSAGSNEREKEGSRSGAAGNQAGTARQPNNWCLRVNLPARQQLPRWRLGPIAASSSACCSASPGPAWSVGKHSSDYSSQCRAGWQPCTKQACAGCTQESLGQDSTAGSAHLEQPLSLDRCNRTGGAVEEKHQPVC